MKVSHRIEIKDDAELIKMRQAGLVVAEILQQVELAISPGVTTGELDQVAREVIARHGATSNFLNYGAHRGQGGFPGVVCASVNDEVVHGIPGDRTLNRGDLVSIDCGAIVDGWHSDAARSFFVGEPTDGKLITLNQVTHTALWQGIAQMRNGRRIGDISAAIEAVATENGYGIADNLVGHGIGTSMHMEPDVPNIGSPGRGPKIVPGMVLAIEPMFIQGSSAVSTLADDWTIVSNDNSWASHWENTVALTRSGAWVLTEADGGEARLAQLGVPFGPLAA